MSNQQKFLDTAPEGFEPTCELKFVRVDPEALFAELPVLCQKWTRLYSDSTDMGDVIELNECWVRVPVEE